MLTNDKESKTPQLKFNPNSIYIVSSAIVWDGVVEPHFATSLDDVQLLIKIDLESLGYVFSHIEVLDSDTFKAFFWFSFDEKIESELSYKEYYLFELTPLK